MMFAVFIVILLAITTGWHYYLGARLIAWLHPAASWGVGMRVTLLALGYSVIVARLMERALPRLYRLCWWLAAVWIGFAFVLFFCLLSGHLAEAVIKLVGKWPGDEAHRYTVGVPAIAAVVLSAFALVQGLREPTLVGFKKTMADLPAAADGLIIAQISDTHIGAIKGVRWTRALVDRVNALEPDLIAVTGDLIDERADGLSRFEPELKRLSAPRGVYAVAGNHEYIHGIGPAVEFMRRVGMRVLENEAVEPVPGLRLVGMHDPSRRSFGDALTDDEVACLIGDKPADRPTVLLYHQPVEAERFATLGVDLMLSGHTHAGQIWPFGLIQKLLAYPRNCGRYEIGAMTLYVSSGTGTWGPPMRLGTRGEIVLVTLQR
jgi:predicted MPP superfamily phosphohydrolase